MEGDTASAEGSQSQEDQKYIHHGNGRHGGPRAHATAGLVQAANAQSKGSEETKI